MTRYRISDEQRKALRKWFQSQHPKPRQSDAAKWFEVKFGHRITQSTVSESLSDRFTYLDTDLDMNKTSFRQRQPKWPILEAILFEWQQRIEQQGGLVTGDILLLKAKEIWTRIP
jgi:Fission yeast centromere protein N-terminal domain